MSLTMSQASLPVFTRMLKNLRAILEKAATHAETRKFDPAALLGARLAPDMFALTRQVQIACDMAKSGAARLAGIEVPRFEDDETTVPELLARIDKTLAFVKSVPAEKIDGSETRDIAINTPRGQLNFKGQEFLLNFCLPNLYFHVATAYNLLRHNGVELGKQDFIGRAG
ncbi:MAG TPA: DUF1993 domain-containing protein [Solimonas sp.]|nr:DUF1993 domain-containing protein [Solimonas sp.]